MNDNFDKCLALVLKSEGGWTGPTGLKGDPGGETNHGVTRNAWASWIKRPVLDGEMAKLTVDEVKPFYKDIYWDGSKCNELPIGVDYVVFDAAINMGVGQAVRLFQRAIGCVPDGVIGPNVMQRITNTKPQVLINLFSTEKENFYRSLKTFSVFGEGWLHRVADVKQNAEEMINDKL